MTDGNRSVTPGLVKALSMVASQVGAPGRTDGPARIGEPFEILIDTSAVSQAVSAENQFFLTADGNGFDFLIDWGDGNTARLSEHQRVEINGRVGWLHSYVAIGRYVVSIIGRFPRIRFDDRSDRRKLREIRNWGDGEWDTMQRAFRLCLDVEITGRAVLSPPKTPRVDSWEETFRDCRAIVVHPDYDTSAATTLRSMMYNNFALIHGPRLDTARCQDFRNLHRSNLALRSTHFYDISSAISTYRMYRNCRNLADMPPYQTAHVHNLHMMYADMPMLARLPDGTRFDSVGQTLPARLGQGKAGNAFGLAMGFSSDLGVSQEGAWSGLRTIENLDFAHLDRVPYLFYKNNRMREIVDVVFPDASAASRTFAHNSALQRIGRLRLPKANNVHQLLIGCSKLRRIELLDLRSAKHVSALFQGCEQLESVVIRLDLAEQLNDLLDGVHTIKHLELPNCRASVNVAGQQLDRSGLVALFASLADLDEEHAQTIHIGWNPGTAALTVEELQLAQAKGWRVITRAGTPNQDALSASGKVNSAR